VFGRSRLAVAGAVLCVSAALAVTGAWALAGGELDPRFGAAGVTTLALSRGSDGANAATVSRDGTLLVAGYAERRGRITDFVVVRLRDDGSPDPGFGAGGVARVDVARGEAAAEALPEPGEIVEQADGKIVLGGWTVLPDTHAGFAFVRLLADGRRDPSFGSDGVVIVPERVFGRYFNEECPEINALALTADGRIVAVGTIGCGGEHGQYPRLVALRLLPDGSLDRSFHGDGRWASRAAGCAASAVHVAADGGLLIAGQGGGDEYCSGGKMRLIRLRADGRYATDWASRGRRTIGFWGFEYASASAMAVDGQGRMLLVGEAEGRLALARVLADGRLDSGFGNRGRRVLPRRARRSLESATGVALAGDGSALVSVDSARLRRLGVYDPVRVDALLARLTPDGQLARAFGARGWLRLPFGGWATAEDVVVDAAGRTFVVGFNFRSGRGNFKVARLR
jgi:uncharacterized delta-60 repeat protein